MEPINFEVFLENQDYFYPDGEYVDDIDSVPMIESEQEAYGSSFDIIDYFKKFQAENPVSSIDEASYQERAKEAVFRVEVMDIEKFISRNNVREITNPAFLAAGGAPTPDGLLSYDIFGTQQRDRAGIFGYIDLGDYFIDPSCYKVLGRLDGKFKQVVLGTDTFSIDKDGSLKQDVNGNTGIKWLKDNFDKIKFKRTESSSRDLKIKYVQHNYKVGRMFINKYIVIPAYYRDINTSGKYTGVGQINTLYSNLLVATRALKESKDYGLSSIDTTCARIQNTLVQIYDWFCGNRNDTLQEPNGGGLSGKFGIIKRANMSYTADYGSRLVMVGPEVRGETIDDLMVTLDTSAAPLAACAASFFPFMMFHMRKFFENEFQNKTTYETIGPDGEVETIRLNNPMLDFTDDVLEGQIKSFCYSRDTRIVPIPLPGVVGDDGKKYFMWFKGERFLTPKQAREGVEPILHRPLTWVDVIYIAAKKATEGKMISFTRFPYDDYFNTMYTKVEVASTKETEPLYVNGEFYKFYPKIRTEDILAPSKGKFIDTMQISNLYLKGLHGDYDGDTGMMKGSFFNETNEELAKFVETPANFIDLGCSNNRVSTNEAVQSIYNFTKVLNADKSKLTEPQF